MTFLNISENQNQNTFKVETPSNNIQVPGVTLVKGYAGFLYSKQKTYKSLNIQNISNLRIVSMNPGDSQELPDDYIFSFIIGGLIWKTT